MFPSCFHVLASYLRMICIDKNVLFLQDEFEGEWSAEPNAVTRGTMRFVNGDVYTGEYKGELRIRV